MSALNEPEGGKSESRVVLDFDREVTEKEMEEMRAKHNAIGASLEPTGDHDHDHNADDNGDGPPVDELDEVPE